MRGACLSPVLLAVALAGCGGADGAVPEAEPGPPRLPGELEVVRTFRAEENEAALNVGPRVRPAPDGGVWVADRREHQVRRYAPDGALLWHVGRRGGGPGAFDHPSSLAPLPGGGLAVIDGNGRLTLVHSAGAVARTTETRILQNESMRAVGDSVLLITGIDSTRSDAERIHAWDLRGDSVRHRFFSPLAGVHNPVAAVFAVKDTVFFLHVDGRPLGQLHLPLPEFRRGPREGPERRSGIEAGASSCDSSTWCPAFIGCRTGGSRWSTRPSVREPSARAIFW